MVVYSLHSYSRNRSPSGAFAVNRWRRTGRGEYHLDCTVEWIASSGQLLNAGIKSRNWNRNPGRVSCRARLLSSVVGAVPQGSKGFKRRSVSGVWIGASLGWSPMAPASGLEIVTGDGELRSEILHNMPTLKKSKPYKPFPVIGTNRHVETIFAALYRKSPNVRYRRECLRMIDGGTITLDWPVSDDDHQDVWGEKLPPDAPVLLLLPGLTGGSHDSYVKHLLVRGRLAGWRPVVFNSRGCSDSPVTSPKFYSASFTEDLRQVVRYLAYRFQDARIYAVGWSLGGNILVRYLGQEEAEDCLISAAVSLCNPFDLVVADECFRKGFNKVYDKNLAKALRRILRKNIALFEGMGGEYDIPKAANAKTVREFDEGLTRVSFGYKSVDEYYADASSSKSIEHVKIPLLCIQAKNDPIAPAKGIPRAAIKANRNCILLITSKGGHLGWVAGKDALSGSPWTDPVVLEYLDAVEALYRDRKAAQKQTIPEDDQTEIVTCEG